MPDVTLPKLADTLVEGTVSRWLKRPGERVEQGEPLVEIETDKVNSELESPYGGVLVEIVVPEGTTVPVGEVIARIEGGEAARPAGGAAETAAAEEPPQTRGLTAMRRRIAERMVESWATVEQGACVAELDLGGIERRAGWTAYFVKAAAAAGGYGAVGVAVEVPDGLVVPVVRDPARLDVGEVAERVADLAGRAREDRLAPAEVLGGEFTVTNVGTGGTLLAFPLVNPGQPGILAPGEVRDGRCQVTLCYDTARLDAAAADDLLARIGDELRRL